MKYKDDKIKDLFSSKLSGFEPEVPASVWLGIENELVQSGVSSVSAVKPLAIKKTLTIATAFVGVVASIVLYTTLKPTRNNDMKEAAVGHVVENLTNESPIVEIKETEQDKTLYSEEEKKLMSDNNIGGSTDKRQTIARASGEKTSQSGTTFKFTNDFTLRKRDEAKGNRPVFVYDYEGEEGEEQASNATRESVKKQSKVIVVKDAETNKAETDDRQRVDKDLRGKSSGLYLSAKVGMGLLDAETNSALSLTGAGVSKQGDIKMKHSRPISLSLLVGKHLTSRLSLETGIIYTRLSSKSSYADQINIREGQKNDYLGIPININYTLFNLGKADIYGTLGATFQKDINGSYTTHISGNTMGYEHLTIGGYSAINLGQSNSLKSDTDHSWQMSAKASLGVSYPIYKSLYIFGTVGGAYYFDPKNTYKTIYDEKKFQLDAHLGLKVKF